MSDISAQEFGRLQAQVESLQRTTNEQTQLIQKINDQLRVMNDTLTEARGGWRMLLLIGGAGAAAGTVLTKVAYWIVSLPVPK